METLFAWLAIFGIAIGFALVVEGVHRLVDYFFPNYIDSDF